MSSLYMLEYKYPQMYPIFSPVLIHIQQYLLFLYRKSSSPMPLSGNTIKATSRPARNSFLNARRAPTTWTRPSVPSAWAWVASSPITWRSNRTRVPSRAPSCGCPVFSPIWSCAVAIWREPLWRLWLMPTPTTGSNMTLSTRAQVRFWNSIWDEIVKFAEWGDGELGQRASNMLGSWRREIFVGSFVAHYFVCGITLSYFTIRVSPNENSCM